MPPPPYEVVGGGGGGGSFRGGSPKCMYVRGVMELINQVRDDISGYFVIDLLLGQVFKPDP